MVAKNKQRLLRRAEVLLQELLNLVGVSFNLAAVQQEGRLGTRSQVLQDVWLPKGGWKQRQSETDIQQKTQRAKRQERDGRTRGRRKRKARKIQCLKPQEVSHVCNQD